MSPEVQNRGISGPMKRTYVLKIFLKKQKKAIGFDETLSLKILRNWYFFLKDTFLLKVSLGLSLMVSLTKSPEVSQEVRCAIGLLGTIFC